MFDLYTFSYQRLKILEFILHAVDEIFEDTPNFYLTEVIIDLKALLEDVKLETI